MTGLMHRFRQIKPHNPHTRDSGLRRLSKISTSFSAIHSKPVGTDPRNSSTSSRQAGFTVIEMIVALTIAVIVLGSIAGSIRLIGRGWDWSVAEVSKQDMIARALDVLSRDLNGLQRIVNIRDDRPYYVFSGTPSEMRFVVVEPPYPTHSGLYCIRLDIHNGDRSSTLVRRRAPYRDGCKGAVWSDEVELINGPYSFQLFYGQIEKDAIVWRRRFRAQDELPGLIKLKVTPDGDAGAVIPDYIIRPRIDAERDCVSLDAPLCAARRDGVLPARLSEALEDSLTQASSDGSNAPPASEIQDGANVDPSSPPPQQSTDGKVPGQ